MTPGNLDLEKNKKALPRHRGKRNKTGKKEGKLRSGKPFSK